MNTVRLHDEKLGKQLEMNINTALEKYNAKENDLEGSWNKLKSIIKRTTFVVLERSKRQNLDWFDNSDLGMTNLIEDRNRARKKHLQKSPDRPRPTNRHSKQAETGGCTQTTFISCLTLQN